MRRIWLILLVLVVVGAGAAIYLVRPVSAPPRDVTLVGDVARGDALIRLGGCVACHTDTETGGGMLAGGTHLQTAFGRFVAPNITADPTHGIGSWTLAQFAAAMDGQGPDGPLYPVFPFQNYTLMSDQEVADLYAALMATTPVAVASAQSEIAFPFNLRHLAAGAWQGLFFRPARFVADPAADPQFERGRYLAYGPAHCVACHMPRNALGAPEWSMGLTGSEGGPGGRAPAITAAALSQEGYDLPTLVQTLKDGFTPNFDILGGAMGEVIAEGTSHWSDADLEALATYLLEAPAP